MNSPIKKKKKWRGGAWLSPARKLHCTEIDEGKREEIFKYFWGKWTGKKGQST
jgi:hypothetical protein